MEKALKPPKSHVLRSGSSVHQHELLAVRKPTFRDFFAKEAGMLGNMWVNVGRERGVGKEASILGNIWVKVGISGLECFANVF